MAQGLQTFDESGKLILDVGDRLTRILGTVVIKKDGGSVSGSVKHDGLLQGDPFYFATGGHGERVSIKTWQNLYLGFTTQTYDGRTYTYPDAFLPSWHLDCTFSGNVFNYKATLMHSVYLIPIEDMTITYGVY